MDMRRRMFSAHVNPHPHAIALAKWPQHISCDGCLYYEISRHTRGNPLAEHPEQKVGWQPKRSRPRWRRKANYVRCAHTSREFCPTSPPTQSRTSACEFDE